MAALLFADKIGFGQAEVVGYTIIVLSLLLVFFGIRSHRDNAGTGQITSPKPAQLSRYFLRLRPKFRPPLLGSSSNLGSCSGRHDAFFHAGYFALRGVPQSLGSRPYSAQLVL